MKKRLLALLVFMAMLTELLSPIGQVIAADEVLDGDEQLKLNKQVEKGDKEDFVLTLEAYAEGQIEAVEVTKPADITLVIDHSASMYTPVGASNTVDGNTLYNETQPVQTLDTTKAQKFGYYIAQSVEYKGWWILQYDPAGVWTSYNCTNNKTDVPVKIETCDKITWTSQTLPEPGVWNYYVTQYGALYDAIIEFTETLHESGVEHQIAIAGFAGPSTEGSRLYDGNAYTTYTNLKNADASVYQSALKNVQNADEYEELRSSINAIYTNYDWTCPTAGINIANSIFKENAVNLAKRDHIMVLFTDGIPNMLENGNAVNTNTQAITNVYDEIIRTTYVSKNTVDGGYGAQVYCISTATLGTGYKDFLNKASSDYPEAQVYHTATHPIANPKYTFTADETNSLTDIFVEITKDTTTTKVKYDETTVMREVLSDYFDLTSTDKEVLKQSIKVYTAAYLGNDDFGEPVPFTDAVLSFGSTKDDGRLDIINVENFDYAENYIAEAVEDALPRGKKLILEVPINAREGFWGGNNVPTNEDKTAIYYNEKLEKPFPMPEVNVPINVTIDASDRTIYYGGDVTPEDLFEKITAGGKDVTVVENADRTFTFVPQEDWMNDYAQIEWTKDSTTTSSDISNKEAKDYDYSVTLKPIYDGSTNRSPNPSNMAGDPVDTNGQTASDKAHVNILVPELTFKDSTIGLGYTPDSDYYQNTNLVGEVVWVDPVTGKPLAPEVMETVTDEEPTITITYKPTGTVDGSNNPEDFFIKDTKVDVNVTSSNDVTNSDDSSQNIEVMDVIKFKWDGCKEEHHDHEHQDIATHVGTSTSHEFWIHVIQSINPDVVVIDYGLPVDINVLANDMKMEDATLVVEGIKKSEADALADSVEGAFGTATVLESDEIRYSIDKMTMNCEEVYIYGATYVRGEAKLGTCYSTVTVIPAANIYFEDSFLSFANALKTDEDGQLVELQSSDYTEDATKFGVWSADGETLSGKTQAQDRPGNTNLAEELDANNVYGYDAAYERGTTFSLGSARQVTVNEATGNFNIAPMASFKFTGTAFDVIALTDNRSGALLVTSYGVTANGEKDSSKIEKSYVVNNYYGYKYAQVDTDNDGELDKWDWVVDADSEDCLYQVPVIKMTDLPYGTHYVEIKAAYMRSMDMTNAGQYTVWLDAIRTYNPAENDETSQKAYDKDGEKNPVLMTLKNVLLAADSFGTYNNTAGAVFIDGRDSVVDANIADYSNQGPNNETYLTNGQGVAFALKTNTDPANIQSIQLGAKLATGTSADLMYNGNKLVTLKTATNMFYKLDRIGWTENTDGTWTSDTIVLSCTAADASIISLTDFKITGSVKYTFPVSKGADAEGIATASTVTLEEAGTYDYEIVAYNAEGVASEGLEQPLTVKSSRILSWISGWFK